MSNSSCADTEVGVLFKHLIQSCWDESDNVLISVTALAGGI